MPKKNARGAMGLRWVAMTASAGFASACLVVAPADASIIAISVGNGPGDFTYTVPAGITSLTVMLVGGNGGNIDAGILRTGGQAASLQGTFPVTPGEHLGVEIGGVGTADGHGGFGGGGDGGAGVSYSGAGGGGATSISRDGAPIMIAAGGGGASYGQAGGNAGMPGPDALFSINGQPGSRATQVAGGAGGAGGAPDADTCTDVDGNLPVAGEFGVDGTLGQGGAGGAPAEKNGPGALLQRGGGGGGGGYFGGGGGGGASSCPAIPYRSVSGAGGGGSNYVDPSVTNVSLSTSDGSGGGTAEVVYDDTTGPVASPTLSPPPNPAGWNSTDVRVDWNWMDDLSGVRPDSCEQQSTTTGEGVSTLSTSCADLVGNTAQASTIVRVDETAPLISIRRPTHRLYERGDRVRVAFACHDALSGIDSCTGTRASGQLLGTRTRGWHTFTVWARDVAGNPAAQAVTYRVVRRTR